MYNSLEIVKTGAFSWMYYPNGSLSGFAISKGYFTADENTGIFQIVEDGKSKRPEVLLPNLTLRDLTTGGTTEVFTDLSALQNRLVNLGCPLAVDTVTGGTAGVNSVSGSNVDNTDPQNPIINSNSFQETTDVSPVTTQSIEVGGLKITGKVDFVTSLLTTLRNVTWQDKDGTVAYLDDITALLEGIAWKQPVELNLDSGVTLSGSIPTITSLTQQGVTLVNNSRVIVGGLANQIFNGIYRVNSTLVSGTYRLYRTNDANTSAELNNAVVGVTSGTYAGNTFRQSTVSPVLGTSNIIFTNFGSSVASATDTIAGIMKLYNILGSNLDGTINQKIISDNFALKFNSADIHIKSLNTDVTMASNVQLNTNLTFPIGANENWVIEFAMSGGCTSSGGTRFQINTPAGSTGSGHVTTSGTPAAQGISVNSPALAVAPSSASQPVRIFMTIRNGATAGNVTLSFASNSNGQTSILRANSYFIATKTTLV